MLPRNSVRVNGVVNSQGFIFQRKMVSDFIRKTVINDRILKEY